MFVTNFRIQRKDKGDFYGRWWESLSLIHIFELDNKFHDILYNASNSKMLDHVLSDFHHYVERVRKVTLGDAKRAKESIEEHKKIVEALRNRDDKKAEKLANEHIMNTIHNMDNVGLKNLL